MDGLVRGIGDVAEELADELEAGRLHVLDEVGEADDQTAQPADQQELALMLHYPQG